MELYSLPLKGRVRVEKSVPSPLRERVRVRVKSPRVTFSQRRQNILKHCVRFLQNLVVPVSHHLESLGFQPLGSLGIVTALFQMLSSVKLDYQPLFPTGKVDDITPDRHLPAELITGKLAVTNTAPKKVFSIR